MVIGKTIIVLFCIICHTLTVDSFSQITRSTIRGSREHHTANSHDAWGKNAATESRLFMSKEGGGGGGGFFDNIGKFFDEMNNQGGDGGGNDEEDDDGMDFLGSSRIFTIPGKIDSCLFLK